MTSCHGSQNLFHRCCFSIAIVIFFIFLVLSHFEQVVWHVVVYFVYRSWASTTVSISNHFIFSHSCPCLVQASKLQQTWFSFFVVCLCHCKHIGFVVSKLVNEWFVVSKLVNEWFVVCVIASDWKNGTMATSASHLDLVKNQGTMLKITYCCCNYDQYYLRNNICKNNENWDNHFNKKNDSRYYNLQLNLPMHNIMSKEQCKIKKPFQHFLF